jgi:spore germination protein YaaH
MLMLVGLFFAVSAAGLSFAPAAHASRLVARHLVVPASFTPGLVPGTSSYNNFGLTREVFGYATADSLGDPNVGYTTWNFDLLATVAFFSIGVNWNGSLVADSDWNVWSSSTLTGLVTTAHSHGVKVVVTLKPRFTDTIDFCDMLYNDASTVLQIDNQVKLKGIDGVNIDYESQLAQCNPTDPNLTPMTNQALLTRFAKDLRAGLNSLGPGYYLSIATYSGSAGGTDGFFNIPDLNQYVDSFFVMAYDMDYANQPFSPLICASPCMAPVSPLTNYQYNDTISMSQYSSVVGAGKVILGQPLYGRVACVKTPVAHADATTSWQTPTYLDAAGAISGSYVDPGTYVIHRDASDPSGLNRWDTWWDNVDHCWREMYWSDVTTLAPRYAFVNQQNLRGVGFWTLNYGGGAAELWSLLQTNFVKCEQASVTSSPPSLTQPAGTSIAFTASSTGCLNPLYEFWVQYPNGTWYNLQAWGGNSFSWNTNGLAPGVYTVHAWANRHPTTTWESYATATLTLTGCSTATVSPLNPSPPAGTVVALTAGSSGCPTPQYEFWIQFPNGTWNLKRGWGAATFNWDTNGYSPGVYTVHAWANQVGAATAAFEAYGSSTVTLTGCTGAALSPANSSAASGSMVALTASSGTCPNPVYEFWVSSAGNPNGSYVDKQPFSPNATFNWDTTGVTAGTYTVHVWANQQDASQSTWESNGSTTVTITPGACTSAGLSPNVASPQTVGTQVTFTASSVGCPKPLYEFWLQHPDGTWHEMQAFSAGATWQWSTGGLARGVYHIHVWANNQGAGTSMFQTYGSATYTLT